MAIYKLGAIALPLAMLFGVEALSYRLGDSGARALITNAQGLEKLAQTGEAAENLALVLSVDGAGDGALGFVESLARASSEFTARDTAADDPALMVYTSGTTGSPKGALHAHRVLLGHLPGIEFPHEFLPQPGDRLLDASRLGLGRRPAQRAAAGTALRRAGGGGPVREVRSGRGLRADGAPGSAQRLHPADRAADAALGWRPARPSRYPAAIGRLRRRGARRRDAGVGQVRARPLDQRVLRPDRMQSRRRVLRGDRCVEARRDRQAGAGPHGRGHPPGWFGVRAGRNRADRDPAARSGDVSGILGQARSDTGEVHRRLDDDRRPGRHRR